MATGMTASRVARASSGRKMSTCWPAPPTAGLKEGVDDSRFESPTWMGYFARVSEHGEGQEEVVPVSHETEEEDQRDDGLGQGQRDVEEGLPFPAPVDARCVEQFTGTERRVVDVSDIDPEREERERQDHGQRAAEQMHRVELEEDREHQSRRRHDHHQQSQHEYQLASPEVPERQAVTRRYRGDQHDRGGADRVEQRVGDPLDVDVVALGRSGASTPRRRGESCRRSAAGW